MDTNKAYHSILKWFGVGSDKHAQLRQFVCSLEAELSLLEQDNTRQDELSNTIKQLREEITQIKQDYTHDDAWSTANKIEKQLCSLLPDDRASIEFDRRLAEAQRVNAPFLDFYLAMRIDADSNASSSASSASKNTQLQMLTTDLQWFYNQRYIKQRYARYAINKVSAAFIFSFLVFVVVLISIAQIQPAKASITDQALSFHSIQSTKTSIGNTLC